MIVTNEWGGVHVACDQPGCGATSDDYDTESQALDDWTDCYERTVGMDNTHWCEDHDDAHECSRCNGHCRQRIIGTDGRYRCPGCHEAWAEQDEINRDFDRRNRDVQRAAPGRRFEFTMAS